MIQGLERYGFWRFVASGLALAAGLTACTSLDKRATSCVEATDCGGGAVCRDGICQATFTVALVSPAGDVAVNGSLAVQVRVDGYEPPEVLLLVGDRELARVLRPNDPALPYTYDWDTSALPEGTYALKAVVTAEWQAIESRVAQVVIDRTKPALVARVPTPGATNVWSRDPITVTFSEPIDLPPAGSVTLVATSPSGAQSTVPVDLSVSDRTLTIRPVSLPPVPSTLSVGLSGQVTDLAGNAVTLSADAWSWTLPEWQQLGKVTSTSRYGWGVTLAVARGGVPIVAAEDSSPTATANRGVLIKEWAGAAEWVERYGVSNYGHDIETDELGRPVMAWQALDPNPSISQSELFVGQWTGTEFSVEKMTAVASSDWMSPTTKVDSEGRGLLAWITTEGGVGTLHAKVRDRGGAWEETRDRTGSLALNSAPSTAAALPRLSFDGDGTPRLSWMETGLASRTWSWTERVWSAPSNLGSAPYGSGCMATAQVDPRGYPVCAVLAGDPVVTIAVFGVDCPTCPWHSIGGSTLNVDTSTSAEKPVLVIDGSGRPIVGWRENGRAHVKRWDGLAWQLLTTSNSSRSSQIAVSSDGIVAAAWSQLEIPTAPYEVVFASRYNR